MKKKGFTLIELLVVVAIIGVLATIILASLSSARKNALDAKTITEVRSLKNALELYYQDKGYYPIITVADPLQDDMVSFCSANSNDPGGIVAVADLMIELSPYLGGDLKIDKCIWYTGNYRSDYSGPTQCNINTYSDSNGYIILYNLPTKKIEPDYYITYPDSYDLYAGNFHCTTHERP